MKKCLVSILLLVVILSTVSRVSAADDVMTLEEMDSSTHVPVFSEFQVFDFDEQTGVLSVLYAENNLQLQDSKNTVVYIAQDLENQSWKKSLLFSNEFFDYAKGNKYMMTIDIGQDNDSGEYLDYLVLVPIEMMPKVLYSYDEVQKWNGEYAQVTTWAYPINRFMVLQIETGDVAIVRNLYLYGPFRFSIGTSADFDGFVNVESDPIYGYTINVTTTKIDESKAQKAYAWYQFFHPKAYWTFSPGDACWFVVNNGSFLEKWIFKGLCGAYFVPDAPM